MLLSDEHESPLSEGQDEEVNDDDAGGDEDGYREGWDWAPTGSEFFDDAWPWR